MNLKDLLKAIKFNESTISTILGVLVVVVVGIFVVNYFRNLEPGNTLPTGINTEDLDASIRSSYTVKEGDSLWTISEEVYGTGYNWVDIKKANSLTDANAIEAGQVLKIPSVEVKAANEDATIATSTPSASPLATVKPSVKPVAIVEEDVDSPRDITGGTYTVVSGDNLWDIATRAYGDGYQWVRIAEANELVNPGIIHAGNVFAIPR